MSKKQPVRPEPQSLGLPLVGVDTHAHLDFPELLEDLDAVLQRAQASGVAQIGQVFLSPEAYHAHQERFAPHAGVFFLLAIHPCEAGDADEATLAAMEAAFRADPRLKGVGETGLDFYWQDKAPHDAQRRAFGDHLALARHLDVPVIIHSRDAFDASVAMLDDLGFAHRPVLWHCFGGDAAQAAELVRRGWTLSIPGPATYRRNEALAQAVAATDLEHLVVETDSPYLAPEPWRGKRNEPAFSTFTAAHVAALKGLDPARVWRRLGDNARRFFGLTPLSSGD